MNWLFWHSSDVFIQAHIETICKLKKSSFRNKYTSLISINSDDTTFRGNTMRYMDVANRLVASPTLCTESINEHAACAYSDVFLLTGNVGAATDRMVTSLYRTVSPRKALSSP